MKYFNKMGFQIESDTLTPLKLNKHLIYSDVIRVFIACEESYEIFLCIGVSVFFFLVVCFVNIKPFQLQISILYLKCYLRSKKCRLTLNYLVSRETVK